MLQEYVVFKMDGTKSYMIGNNIGEINDRVEFENFDFATLKVCEDNYVWSESEGRWINQKLRDEIIGFIK